jgi:VWFA-related protein
VFATGLQETHVTLTVLKDVVRRMSAMPGQRIVVLISPGFFSPTEYQSDRSDILDRAIRANVVINSLDARGLWTDQMFDASQQAASTPAFLALKQQYDRKPRWQRADVLAEMADGTGGSLFENNNDLDQGMRELGGAPEYYVTYVDGSFHEGAVRAAESEARSRRRWHELSELSVLQAVRKMNLRGVP